MKISLAAMVRIVPLTALMLGLRITEALSDEKTAALRRVEGMGIGN